MPASELVAVDAPGIAVRFGYDALGRRQEQQADGVVTRFLYDGSTRWRSSGRPAR